MLPEKELRNELLVVPLVAVTGPWTRALLHRLLHQAPPGAPAGSPPQPLWAGGPALRGARFTPKGAFESIYLASDPITALREVEAIFVNPHGPPVTIQTPPWTVFAVNGFLQPVLDLSDPAIQARLATSVAELTGDWRFSQAVHLAGEGPLPPTQLLGRAAFETARIAGIRYRSARRSGEGFNVVVFSDRLDATGAGFLEVFDPAGLIRQKFPA